MRLLPILLLAPALVAAQEDVSALLEQKAMARIQAYDHALEGALGVAAIDLTTGHVLAYHADTVFPTASSIKVPVMIEIYRLARAGQLRLDQEVPVDPKEVVDGSLRLQPMVKRGLTRFGVREVLAAMIEVSDNTAANKMIELAGMDRVNAMLDELGLHATRLRRKMMDWAAAARGDENVSTPREMARLAELLYRGKVVDEAACHEMLGMMKNVDADLRRAVPDNIEVAAKPGDLPGARCEMGIVYLPKRPFAVAIMSAYLRNEADPVPEVAAILYRLFARLAESNQYGRR